MAQVEIVTRVSKLRIGLFRELNDIHIFVSHTMLMLNDLAKNYRARKSVEDRPFRVPSRMGKKGIAMRTAKEVADLLERFAQREMHANHLLVCVSRFEAFLNDVLRIFLVWCV